MKYLATALMALLAVPAYAQQQCTDAATMEEIVSDQYGEHLSTYGVHEGVVYQFWINEETGTWSIVRSNGASSCMMAAGDGGAGATEFAPKPNL